METDILVLVAIAVNMVIGAGVWAGIDDKDQQLYRWYKDCPQQIAWLAQPLALMVWPVTLWMWWKNKRNN